MNVRELREALASLPDESMVVVHGYEGGVSEVKHVEPCDVALDVHDEWYYGEHDHADAYGVSAGSTIVPAVQVG